MFQPGFCLLLSSELTPCEVSRNLGKDNANTWFLLVFTCCLTYSSAVNFLDCHSTCLSFSGSRLADPLAFHSRLWWHLSHGPVIFCIQHPGTRWPYPEGFSFPQLHPHQAQGLLTFKNHSSGTQHQILLLAAPSLLFCKSTQRFAPCCSKKEHTKKSQMKFLLSILQIPPSLLP